MAKNSHEEPKHEQPFVCDATEILTVLLFEMKWYFLLIQVNFFRRVRSQKHRQRVSSMDSIQETEKIKMLNISLEKCFLMSMRFFFVFWTMNIFRPKASSICQQNDQYTKKIIYKSKSKWKIGKSASRWNRLLIYLSDERECFSVPPTPLWCSTFLSIAHFNRLSHLQ